MNLDELIERLEKATGPDRELDLAIANMDIDDRAPWRFFDPHKESVTRDQYGRGAVGNPVCGLERFTRYVDDAAEVLPTGHIWLKKSRNVFTVVDDRIDYDATKTWPVHHEATHQIPAIAVCIASLKARRMSAPNT